MSSNKTDVEKDGSGNEDEENNFALFRDCLFSHLTGSTEHESKKKPKRHRRHSLSEQVSEKSSDPSELVDFSDYIATEVFPFLSQDLRRLSHRNIQEDVKFSDKWSLPLSLSTFEEITEFIPSTAEDSLVAYGFINPPKSDMQSFISPVVSAYVYAATTPPPKWISTKVSNCEICDRDWVPMTYHHLIPKQIHPKVLKRGWHDEQQLNSVAWLCRACHSFVHRMASNEELARDWYTIELICSREDVKKWAQWISRVRWKKK